MLMLLVITVMYLIRPAVAGADSIDRLSIGSDVHSSHTTSIPHGVGGTVTGVALWHVFRDNAIRSAIQLSVVSTVLVRIVQPQESLRNT
jgi:hypothetical protein